ncbi:MAG: 16S rRNA (guanine(527)-N(7))-methyltransferase RsmG [Porticoccaceae bacterium]|nr:16S rRNA (guanine(527)-N(7))-methyltransferase RsmG [Porticoccaceae bacterium]
MSLSDRQQELQAGINTLGLDCTSQQEEKLLKYLELLERWNKAYNLTAIRDPIQMVRLHLLDSLAIHPYIQAGREIIDVGTGPGLPGIPLAILNPNINFTLLDSNGKKTRFLFQAISDLSLVNAREVNQRVENFQPQKTYDIVLSRAFSAISDMLNQCDHLVSDTGYFLAMKGKKPDSELSQITKAYKVVDLSEVKVPQIDSERHLIKIIKTGDSQ